jgi:hypothetical protein
MNWAIVLESAGIVLALFAGYIGGREVTRVRMLLVKPPVAPSRADETLLVHEATIDGDALRFTVRTRKRVASFLVPREAVYQMSDDLMRSAAQLGKREQPQRGPE